MPFSKHLNAELYNKFSDDLQLAGFAKRTFDGYLREIRKLADHCQCSLSTFLNRNCGSTFCT